jgi:hypothetical protein
MKHESEYRYDAFHDLESHESKFSPHALGARKTSCFAAVRCRKQGSAAETLAPRFLGWLTVSSIQVFLWLLSFSGGGFTLKEVFLFS